MALPVYAACGVPVKTSVTVHLPDALVQRKEGKNDETNEQHCIRSVYEEYSLT